MPEYLAPGVYVEETSFRQKTIEGVSTSTAGFVGPTRFGPTRGEPELLTSFLDFERIYGGIDQLEYAGAKVHNDLAHAVRAFFENGGRRLYVSRTYDEGATDGVASCATHPSGLTLRARWPGAAGNFRVLFEINLSDNILVDSDGTGPAELKGALRYDTVLVSDPAGAGVSGISPGLYYLDREFDSDFQVDTFKLLATGSEVSPPLVSDATGLQVRVVTVSVTITGMGQFMDPRVWDGLAPHPEHRNALTKTFAPAAEASRSTELFVPLIIETQDGDTGVDIVTALVEPVAWPVTPLASSLPAEIADEISLLSDGISGAADAAAFLELRFVLEDQVSGFTDDLSGFAGLGQPVEVLCELANGSDGDKPAPAAYEGDESAGEKSGLKALEDLEDISIVAAPGSTRDVLSNGASADAATIQQLLIGHAERMRYRIAVLDSPNGAILGQIRDYRAKIDSKYAALYYPWVKISDPVTETEILAPPSGFVTGIYARNDVERGVHKAPANEVVRLAVGFEYLLNKAQQDVLNPRGINCLRFFEGRGYRVWGARTVTSDPEWKYVNLRRYFAFLEHSIDRGTQWAVFEPNGSALWANVRRTVEDFLFNEWKSGHLMGETPEEAYFVKCDRSTMTQNDIDNGRLICLIGVAPLRPAEFVIFRIGQKTLPGLGGS